VSEGHAVARAPRIPLGVRATYALIGSLVVPTLAALTRREYSGFEHLPREGGCIVALNHITELDPVIVGHAFYVNGICSTFLAKDKLFVPPVMGWAMRGLGHIPVERGGGGKKSLDAAQRVLDYGGVIVIYPEGTLTRDPDLWPMVGRTGAARLALETGAPLFAAAQWGAHRILPPYARRVTLLPRRTLQVTVGPQLDVSAYQGLAHDRDALAAVTNLAMDATTTLLARLRNETPPATRFDPTVGRASGGSPHPA
jgi:1-acyl-sn-glycerol-3-phosphate acyltransferase